MKVIAWPAFKTRYKNPFTWLLYSQMRQQGVEVDEFSPRALLMGRYDILHLHWPVETLVRHPTVLMALVRVVSFWFCLEVARLKGTRVIWTIHDERPHVLMHTWLANAFQAILVRRVDGYISLCQAGQQSIQRALPSLLSLPGFVVPHGHYRDVYNNIVDPTSARQRLKLPTKARTLLFLGYISPYKNVAQLIKIFRQLPDSDLRLVIAGNPDTAEMAAEIRQLAASDKRIVLHLRFIPDDELQVFFNAADLVVLPFTAILNSGSVPLSLSFNRPVLVPALGALPEWQGLVGKDWVRTYDGELSVGVLLAAIAAVLTSDRPAHAPLGKLDWAHLSQQTIEAYCQLRRPYREPQAT